jgi:hypothetical protein
LEEILNFRGQERIHSFRKIFTNGEFITVNPELLKIILSQVGASNFKYNTRSHVMKACKLFIFWYQVALMLRNTGWKGLIGHLKDRGKYDLISRASSFQPGETDAGEI